MKIKLSELAQFVEGKLLSGDPDSIIEGFASLDEAVRGDLSFFYDTRYLNQLSKTEASALLVGNEKEAYPEHIACILVEAPSKSFEQVVEKYGVQPKAFEPGVHPSAVVEEGVTLDPAKVSIGPQAVVRSGTTIANGATIGAGCYVGYDCEIGSDTTLTANVTIGDGCILGERVRLHPAVVIGGDGFGYVFEEGRHRKVQQSGIVVIDNDVEIGAGSTVDRARFGRTWIGEGTKIDNLVQIGHNCVIGKHCILVACCAIAGSAHIDDYVVMGAQCASQVTFALARRASFQHAVASQKISRHNKPTWDFQQFPHSRKDAASHPQIASPKWWSGSKNLSAVSTSSPA